jgi:uncharacterized protein (UPF0332 family)
MSNGNPMMAYWLKSRENLEISDYAQSEGKFNAAMSRYYYALRFAIGAVFLKRGLHDPIPMRHWELRRDAANHLKTVNPDLKAWLKTAQRLRERGDYSRIPVMFQEFKILTDELDGIFTVVKDEISESE